MTLTQWLQSVMPGGLWDNFWLAITHLHSENALMVLVPTLFWLTEHRFALLFSGAVLGSQWLTELLKELFALDRPAGLGIRVIGAETGMGRAFPSGHALGSTVTWLLLAGYARRRWFTATALIIVFLIGVSRLYLGLHWPIDIVGGWAIGLVLVFGLAAWAPALARYLGRSGPLGQVLVAAAPPLAALILFRRPVAASSDLFALTGAWLGLWVGSTLAEHYVRYRPQAPGWAQVPKVVMGLGLLLALRLGLKAVFPLGEWYTYVRYVLLGLTAGLVVPWLFVRLGLGARRPAASQPWAHRPGADIQARYEEES